jgi:hypothetical protein
MVLGAGAPLAMADGSVQHASGTLAARVTYQWKPCDPAPDRLASPRPVTAGTLVLKRGGKRVRVSLLPGGTRPARVSLPGQGRIAASLELVTPRVRITDPAGVVVKPIRLRGGVAANGRVAFFVPRQGDHGHVNTLIGLQRAARVAAVTAPRQLRRLDAHVFAGPAGGRPPARFVEPATIEVGQTPHDAEWEPTALAHEYGHFILHSLGAEGPDGGDHDLGKSYPKQPTLAWNEGFSHAFAAIVLKEGQGSLTNGCAPYANLADQPARPSLATDEDRRYAQYSETRVAGATYNLVKRLGGGETGLKRLLRALPSYRRDGHSVWTARDLRDLVVHAFERSAADHAAYDRVFFAQGMSWQRRVNVGIPLSDPEFEKILQAGATVTVRVTGPGGFDCRSTIEIDGGASTAIDGGGIALGLKRADGGLGFSANDDCYLTTGSDPIDFNNPHTFGGDHVEIPFPYLAGLGHWGGEYTVFAKFLCEFDTRGATSQAYCPTVKQVDVTADSLLLLVTSPAARQPVPVALARGVETKIATFRANGECTVMAFDCGF